MRPLPRLATLTTALAFLLAIHGERLRMVECLRDTLAGHGPGTAGSHHHAPRGDQPAPRHGTCLCLGLCHTQAAPAPDPQAPATVASVAARAPGFRPATAVRPVLIPFAHPFAQAPPILLG